MGKSEAARRSIHVRQGLSGEGDVPLRSADLEHLIRTDFKEVWTREGVVLGRPSVLPLFGDDNDYVRECNAEWWNVRVLSDEQVW